MRLKILIDADKPADGRYKSKESILSQIDCRKKEVDSRRPLTEGEFERLNEEFIMEYIYYNAFDEYHVKHNLSAMENLFAGYINSRLKLYLKILQE